jgi:hypothetical protein
MSNTLTRRKDIAFASRAIQASSVLPAMARQAFALLGAVAMRIAAGLEAWSASRKLQAAPEGMLKDMGVARCGIDWAVRHGRGADPL